MSDKLLEQEIVQNFVYDIQTNSIDCTLNSKYDLNKDYSSNKYKTMA